MTEQPEFRPLLFLNTGYRQTFAAIFWPTGQDLPPTKCHHVLLPDGDQLSLIENASCQLPQNAPICLLVHGLTGSHQSNYMIRLARMLQNQYRVIRLNLRGCGTGAGLAQKPYHSGRSDDLLNTIEYLTKQYPNAPLHVLSFSLGANIALKMAGEQHTHPPNALTSVVAVSPPIDLLASVKRIQARPNRLFDQYFTRALIKSVERIHAHFPALGPVELPPMKSVLEFDNAYTAPTCGFRDAYHYYEEASARYYLSDIRLPTMILFSKDDPLVSNSGYQPVKYNNPYLNWVLPAKGGHVAFLGQTGKRFSYQWMDNLIFSWLNRFKS